MKKRLLVPTLAAMATLIGCIEPESPSTAEAALEPQPGARYQPGTEMGIYTPEQHIDYDGRFIVSASRVYHVGTLDDISG